jgi:ribosomal protein S18 acetylase RimI-like enzyme
VTEAAPRKALEIRRAGSGDLAEAAAILEDAIEWADRRGFRSWEHGTFSDPEGWGRERLEEALRSDGLFLVTLAGTPVATFSLLPEDRLFWPDAADDALYLHRFAVPREHSGRGVGAEALVFMRGEVRRAGRRYLRLDCLADNPGIRAYYERAGFEHRGDTVVHDIRFSLYELDLSATGTGP